MTISVKDSKFVERAAAEGAKSKCLMRHGCLAVLNGRIVGRGHNHHRSRSSDGFMHNSLTCHAEIAAIRDAYRNFKLRGDFRHQLKGEQQAKVSKDDAVYRPHQPRRQAVRISTVY